MGIPVERLNPFDLCDLSQLSEEERQMAEENPHEFAVAVGLAQNQLSPAAFALSVLPTALKRMRDFQSKGIWAAAAAVVMLGVLFLIYKGRNDASAEYASRVAKLKREESKAKRQDGQLRGVLQSAQEEEVKHRLLAELSAPGLLLSQVMAEVRENIKPHIYVHTVHLKVDKPQNVFDYYIPRLKRAASGYEKASRILGVVRQPHVLLSGRISGGQNPSQLYQEFVQALQSNKRGLMVETRQRFRAGRQGRDGTFELEFFPGTVLKRRSKDEGRPIVLRDIVLDDKEEPSFFLGRRADGVQIRVPIDQVSKKQADELVAKLKAL